MSAKIPLTSNAAEADISSLISGKSLFEIPYFQRPYRWNAKRIGSFQKDLLSLLDDESSSHFFGAVIMHGRHGPPSDPTRYEVIDGQQRITTLYLHLAAGVKVLVDLDRMDEAFAYVQSHMALVERMVKQGSNFKLQPCKEDRNQLNAVIVDLCENQVFSNLLGDFKPKMLTNTGAADGRLFKNYNLAKAFFQNQAASSSVDQVISILDAMLERVTVVQIEVLDPTSGPKIFDRLNARQEPMTVGDLIRNEIFARVSSLSPAQIDYIDETEWQPFYKQFVRADGTSVFEGYLFPYALTSDPNLNKAEVRSSPQKMGSDERAAAYHSKFADVSKCLSGSR